MSPGKGVPPLDLRLLLGVKKRGHLKCNVIFRVKCNPPMPLPEAPIYPVEGTEELKLWALGRRVFSQTMNSVIFSRLLVRAGGRLTPCPWALGLPQTEVPSQPWEAKGAARDGQLVVGCGVRARLHHCPHPDCCFLSSPRIACLTS